MELSDYQKRSRVTAIYPNAGANFVYPTLGLAGETGEVVEKVKKLMRNEGIERADAVSPEWRVELAKEMGDVLWYLAQLATEFDLDLDDIAEGNLEKLLSRKERGVLHSEGDNR
ncbi:MAG TPA: nucleoside triphosphate pyrophosphohydrolase family protein [Candidatus Paceibacterota bacterium]|nr:nucleoside triphosphate pyrophosphohydrolase family protein [Candidatus Paceibacterota bacterium]